MTAILKGRITDWLRNIIPTITKVKTPNLNKLTKPTMFYPIVKREGTMTLCVPLEVLPGIWGRKHNKAIISIKSILMYTKI